MGVCGYGLYVTTYTREQCGNFNFGYPQSALHMVALKYVGTIHIQTRISPNVQETELCCSQSQNAGQGIGRMHLQALLDQGVRGPGQAASAGHHSCFPMVNPTTAVRCLVNFPAWSLDLFGRQFTSWRGHICYRRGRPSYLPPYLHQPNNQKFSLFT